MKLIDKLKDCRKKALLLENRNYEFNATLHDHPIGNQDIYRLYYVDFHRIGESYGMGPNNIGEIDWPLDPFKMPEGMSREDGFKVLSYLTDFIEKRDDVQECSLCSVKTLDSAINLERFGFRRVCEKNPDNIIDLFTVTGRLLLFKRSRFYDRYFEWYQEGVSRRDVEEIYKKLGMDFLDIVWQDDREDKKVYEKKKV